MAFENDYVPMNMWHKDHWSTLAYIETVMVDVGGFQVGYDPHMKSNRMHFRIMSEQCSNPRRARKNAGMGMVMEPQHATVLKDGSLVDKHDDWCCLQDMAVLGLFDHQVEDVEPGVTLKFSDYGHQVASALRRHKANGGTFATFVCDI